ncbi:MAG: hypothetical protein ACREO8_07275 [Luteimonas sp.]
MLKKIKTTFAGIALAASMALMAPVAMAGDIIIIIICDTQVCDIIIIAV